MPQENDLVRPVPLTDNQFIDAQTGVAMLPSLINPEDELKFKIKRDWYINGYPTVVASVRQIRHYELFDQYNDVLDKLDFQEQYWLQFIGMFKSVQKLQLKREARLFPQQVSENNLDNCLKHLFMNGLIMKWEYYHPIDDAKIPVYTLTGNGYRLLINFYNQNYFHPQNFFNLNPRYHLRFWETLDVYQLLISLPAYKGSSTWFQGEPKKGKRILPSPLQINLELNQGKPKNLVFYPVLYNDNINYYKDVTLKWSNFTDEGQSLNKPINDLPMGQNVLTFYVPTLERAAQLNDTLKLANFAFPSLFLVGFEITSQGLPKAFYLPDRQTKGLRQYSFPDVLREGTINENKENN